ncbi:MAG: hypothetical protein ACPG7F_18325, partial [Aggregatilineales bacterium]
MPMPAIENAILRTILYADVFKFAITLQELHTYLIYHTPVSIETIETALQHPRLQKFLCISEGYITLKENSDYIQRRKKRQALVDEMQTEAKRYGHWLSRIPFMRMVALTGALAADNPAHAGDDIDYLLITKTGRVWFVRAIAVIMVRVVRLRGVEICPNFVLSEEQLQQKRQDLYIARELVQMQPLYGQPAYEAMWQENNWLRDYMPNASLRKMPDIQQSGSLKTLLEKLLSGKIGDMLDTLEYRRKSHQF